MYKSCWCLSIILALQMLHDSNFEASLKYIEKPYLVHNIQLYLYASHVYASGELRIKKYIFTCI